MIPANSGDIGFSYSHHGKTLSEQVHIFIVIPIGEEITTLRKYKKKKQKKTRL